MMYGQKVIEPSLVLYRIFELLDRVATDVPAQLANPTVVSFLLNAEGIQMLDCFLLV